MAIYNITVKLRNGQKAQLSEFLLEKLAQLQMDDEISSIFQMLFADMANVQSLVLHDADALDIDPQKRLSMLQTIDDVMKTLTAIHYSFDSGRTLDVDLSEETAPQIFDRNPLDMEGKPAGSPDATDTTDTPDSPEAPEGE